MIGARLRSFVLPGVRSAGQESDSAPVRAEWHGEVLAESTVVRAASGHVYFPPDTVRWDHLESTDRQTICPWKGIADYYDLVVGNDRNANAAWTYATPLPGAQDLEGWVAFWGGVRVRRQVGDPGEAT